MSRLRFSNTVSAIALGIIGLLLVVGTFVLLRQHQGIDRFTEISAIATAIGAIANTAAALFIYGDLRATRRQEHLELAEKRRAEVIAATRELYISWWSNEMRSNRQALARFIEDKRAVLMKDATKSMKDVDHNVDPSHPNEGSVLALVHFFDRVGWLGAAGLIDVDYVLGPMQHVMRRTWTAMSPLIKSERDYKIMHGERLDPVYNFGFEWLYNYSSRLGHDQATLMAEKYGASSVFPNFDQTNMKLDIDTEERAFAKYLRDKGGIERN